MAKQLFGNNASALLAASISDSDLTIQVQNGFGALFPNPGADEYFLATLENDSGDIEVVKVTARAVDLFTVPVGGRGQEGTSAQAWTNGQARVELRLTRGTMETFIQRGGDAMEGDLNMDGNDLIDAKLTGASTQILAGEIVDVPLRGNAGDSSNEVRVPTDGTRATAGGARILTENDVSDVRALVYEVGMVMDWYGVAANCPAGWAICNGSNGTPDLRNQFIRGASVDGDIGAGGGAASVTTSANGGHDHSGVTGGHALTEAENGPHTHSSSGQITLPFSNDDNSQKPATAIEGSSEQLNGTVTLTATFTVGSSGSGTEHTHPITAADAHTHTADTVPPFKYLYKIMYVGP